MKNFTITLLMLIMCTTIAIAGTYSGGTGTESDPYQIATTDDLIELSQGGSGYFIQTADIIFNPDETQVDWDGDGDLGDTPWGFSPIGSNTYAFWGAYDGQGHTIENLFIDNVYADYRGLFSNLYAGTTIKNLGLINVDITGRARIGALLGQNEANTTISNCYSTGTVTVKDQIAGGLIGMAYYDTGEITNCYSSCTVIPQDGDESSLGGLVGINKSQITNCYSTGSIKQDDFTSSTCGEVGGLIGKNESGGIVTNCYSIAEVQGYKNVGGLCGINYGRVENCYSAGVVNGIWATRCGGLIGGNTTYYVYNSFWDTETSGQSYSWGGGTGKTTEEMQDQDTFINAGWDFTDTWHIDSSNNNGYPYLSWQWFGNLFISEVSDNPTGENAGTGFIELWNSTGVDINLNGYSIHRGTNDGSGFVSGGTSYTITSNYIVPANEFFVVGNGADLTTFNDAWGLSLTSDEYDAGNSSLEFTNGHAYGLDNGARFIVDETVQVNENDRIYQQTGGTWIEETPATGTPGELGDDDSPLPVTLSSFTGIYANGSSLLQWSTQSEVNNAGWNVYRAEREDYALANKINPEMINGAGTTSDITEYSYADESGFENAATYYYWLESVDYANVSSLHGPISVEIENQDEESVPDIDLETGIQSIYPNPFNPSTTISYYLSKPSEVNLEIFNAKGQKIYSQILNQESEGMHYFKWNGVDSQNKTVTSGIYLFRLKTNDSIDMKKAILMK